VSFDSTTTPASGDDTQLADYTRLRDNDRSLAGAGQSHDLGGSLDKFVEDTTEVDLPDGWDLEINGAELGGRTVKLEVNVIGETTTNVTVTVRLWNITDAGAVASSAVAVVNPSTTRTRGVSGALTLPAAAKRYKAQIKGSVGASAKVAARARVIIT
jgi:hypothetical protein